jgi:cell division protease FtsH
VFAALIWTLVPSSTPIEEVAFSQFQSELNSGLVTEIQFSGRSFTYIRKTPTGTEKVRSMGLEPDHVFNGKLLDLGVNVSYTEEESDGFLKVIFISLLPIIVLIAVFYFFMRQSQSGSQKLMSIGKNRARVQPEGSVKTTFKDVAGIDEARDELEEIIHFLKDPKRFERLGGRIPRGVLLMGAPGTGKTLLARAIAGESDVPFFSISGSDFIEMFVGVGASRVRDLFEQGKKKAPCIIFIDEIDAVGRQRGAGLGGGHDEREQTLNQLLVEMDGFETNSGVIVVAATNRPDVLDSALLRPGRFDRQIVIPRPDIGGREGILTVHIKNTPLAPEVSLLTIARGTPGFSGADLENLVNEAALLAARKSKDTVDNEDFEEARDKILMGAERRSMIITDSERRTTAFHEAGHTLTARLTPGTDPVHKVTIIPRGRTIGITQQLPIEDRLTVTRGFVMAQIAILMSGRVAEEIALGELSSGAGQDLKQATRLAHSMVCEWGMSDRMGPLHYGQKEEAVFLGRDMAQHQKFSAGTIALIDEEVQKIVMTQYNLSRVLIESNLPALHALAAQLLVLEVLNGEEVDNIISDHKVQGEAGFFAS